MSALTGSQRRRVQAGGTMSHLSLAAAAEARKGHALTLELELADGTRLELSLAGVVSWGVSRPDAAPPEPVLACIDREGKRKRARLARMLDPVSA